MIPPVTGDPWRDGFNCGYFVGVILGCIGCTAMFTFLLLMDVFA